VSRISRVPVANRGEYDSPLAKVLTVGKDRTQAIAHMQYALANLTVSGIATTIIFL